MAANKANPTTASKEQFFSTSFGVLTVVVPSD